MPQPLVVPEMTGALVRLEPLAEVHVAGLAVAAAEDRSSYGFTMVPSGRDEATRYVRDLLAGRDRGECAPFAQVSVAEGRPVGATRYLTIRRRAEDQGPYAVEIGGTWLAASAQRTGINPEAKLLLLAHAFDVWHVGRVDVKTDARNDRARRAISALGATCEGTLRSWQPSQVTGEEPLLRDSAMYSIVASEWPSVRHNIEGLLRSRAG